MPSQDTSATDQTADQAADQTADQTADQPANQPANQTNTQPAEPDDDTCECTITVSTIFPFPPSQQPQPTILSLSSRPSTPTPPPPTYPHQNQRSSAIQILQPNAPRSSTHSTANTNSSTPHQNPNENPIPTPISTPTFLSRPFDRLLALYMVAIVGVTVYVLVHPPEHKELNRLRTWLYINAAITVIRITGWITTHCFPRHRWRKLRYTLLWLFRVLNMFSIVWSMVGIVYLRNASREITENTLERKLVIIIIVIELVVLALSILLSLVIFLFALRPVLSSRHVVQGATKEDLSRLRSFRYSGEEFESTTCSICLSEYQPEEVLRELPCAVSNHVFHAACIDEWLMQKLSCPICRDDPLSSRRMASRSSQRSTETDSSLSPPPPVIAV